MEAIDLFSSRLHLKRLTINHLSEDYVSWLNDENVYRYLETQGDYTLEKLSVFLTDQESKNILFWAIHERQSEKHIGNIKIDPINLKNESGEYGMILGDRNFWAKGIAREASQLVINYCFHVLKFKKITLGVLRENEAALLLYKKLGFISDEVVIAAAGCHTGKSVERMSLSNNNQIGKLILGTVQMGLPYGINNMQGQISKVESIKILNEAYESGIRTLDSAAAYGDAHKLIGDFHKLYPQKKFKIITKLPNDFNADIESEIELYLNELGLSSLHGLLFHSYANYKQSINKMSCLTELKKNKKIELIGVSVYTNEELEDVSCDKEIDIIQFPFNLFDNLNKRKDAIKKAKENGKILHARSCFLQGLFFKDLKNQDKIVLALKEELITINELSKKHGISMNRLALSYCLSQSSINQVLIGVDSLNQLQQNSWDANFYSTENLITEIEKIDISNLNLLNPSRWKNL